MNILKCVERLWKGILCVLKLLSLKGLIYKLKIKDEP